jgi:hypothetical protein
LRGKRSVSNCITFLKIGLDDRLLNVVGPNTNQTNVHDKCRHTIMWQCQYFLIEYNSSERICSPSCTLSFNAPQSMHQAEGFSSRYRQLTLLHIEKQRQYPIQRHSLKISRHKMDRFSDLGENNLKLLYERSAGALQQIPLKA